MRALFIGGEQDGKIMQKPSHSPWQIMGDPPEIRPIEDFTGKECSETLRVDTYVELRLGDYFVYHCITMTHEKALEQLLNHYKKP